MTPELRRCFSVTVQVNKPIIVSHSPQTGKRQLIPITGDSVLGQFRGHTLPDGADSQIIEPDDTCGPSARYALQVAGGTVYTENNGIRRASAQYHDQLFTGDMRSFNDIPSEVVYFRTVPFFEVDTPALSRLIALLFICTDGWTQDGVMFDLCQVG